jgi:hypothetical protein
MDTGWGNVSRISMRLNASLIAGCAQAALAKDGAVGRFDRDGMGKVSTTPLSAARLPLGISLVPTLSAASALRKGFDDKAQKPADRGLKIAGGFQVVVLVDDRSIVLPD